MLYRSNLLNQFIEIAKESDPKESDVNITPMPVELDAIAPMQEIQSEQENSTDKQNSEESVGGTSTNTTEEIQTIQDQKESIKPEEKNTQLQKTSESGFRPSTVKPRALVSRSSFTSANEGSQEKETETQKRRGLDERVKVSIDAALDVLLTNLEHRDSQLHDMLRILFVRGDTNGDGVLTLDEFRDIVRTKVSLFPWGKKLLGDSPQL